MGVSQPTSAIKPGKPPTPERLEEIRRALVIDGYFHLGPTLEPSEVDALRDALERKLSDPAIRADEAGDHFRGNSQMRMFEYDTAFRDLIVREPFATIAEAVLGDDCHVMSQNALANPPGFGGGWHLDDICHFPVPEGVEGHSPDIPPPCLILQIFTPLTDLDTLEAGPTMVVPGSHLAGRKPPRGDSEPTFRGRGPTPIFAKTGDAYLFNNQVWHQGGKNQADHVRLLGGVTYSKRFIAQRFYPFVDYRMPDHVWLGAGDRLQRFLGRHKKGPYG